MKLVLFFIAILLTTSGFAQSSNGWRGIIPLHSSRSEARLILGEPKEEGKYSDLFLLSDVKVDIIYAPGPCKGPITGWNVKSGTVLTILVIPMRKTYFDESNLPADFIKGPVNDDLSVEYTSIERGIRYTVSEFGDLGTIYYMPSKRDSDLRCDNEEARPAENDGGSPLRPLVTESDLTSQLELASEVRYGYEEEHVMQRGRACIIAILNTASPNSSADLIRPS